MSIYFISVINVRVACVCANIIGIFIISNIIFGIRSSINITNVSIISGTIASIIFISVGGINIFCAGINGFANVNIGNFCIRILRVCVIMITNVILTFSISIIYGILNIGIIVYKLHVRSAFHVRKGIRGVGKLPTCSTFIKVRV